MLKAIALDDEPLALKIIESFCGRISNIQLEKTFNSHTDVLKYIHKHPVDLLFLDIQMPTVNGISFYKSLEQAIPVIFTTAFENYAVEGFNVDAVDYLVKPFSFERFEEAVQKAVSRKSVAFYSDELQFISVRSNYKLNKVFLKDILFIQSLDNYIIIYLESGDKLTVQMPLKDILMKLPSSRFIRVHRSYIIGADYLEKMTQKTVQVKDTILPVGEKYKDGLKNLL